MKLKKKRTLLIVILGLIVFLILPPAFKNKPQRMLTGPDLSEIEYSEITFENKADSLKLAGMLMLPEGDGPFPVVVFIHGSGPSFRNSVWYLSVAKHLTNNGIAVVLPDKRGCEKSEGEWIGADFNQLASDVLAAVEYVKGQNTFDYSEIGVLGMSQGGWIAPVAATKSADIDFVATMSGATVTTDEQLVYEEINNMEPYTYRFIAKALAPLTSKRISKMPHQKALVGFDPIPYWQQIHVPVFIGFGGDDRNVPVDKCKEKLKVNNLNNFLVKVYPKGGHAISDPVTNKVSAEYLDDLVAFIPLPLVNTNKTLTELPKND
ncbi:alpha/beta fold hydrolase [uncultured Draconibacterium sp.]|uniref:alpha/beta hydrolase family protein n=1 Tax=uncultured Draconibacterium sp. TaxID=1573823 RepID=UPI002AA94638|nr:alpha/beta fold hydrolase [uncultured Draconibacterium sp.]